MIKKVSKDEVEVKFYGEIGRWTLRDGKNFSQLFGELESKYKKITIRLHCYGGEVFEGNVIYNTILNSSAEVTIIIDGVAASMGSIIMLAGVRLRMAENAYIMIHNPSGGVYGNAASHLSAAKLLRSMEKNFIKKYCAKTGQSEEQVAKYFDGNDHWIDAQEAKELGLVNAVIDKVADIQKLDKAKAQSMGIEAVYNRFQALTTIPPNQPKNKNISEMDKALMIARYSLTGVTAESSDTAIMEAIDKKFNSERDKRIKAESDLKTQRESEITSMIEAKAKEPGVEMTEEQKKTYQMIGETSGIEALRMTLGTLTPRATITETIRSQGSGGSGTGGENDRKNWTWNDYAEKDPTTLEKMEKDNKEQFNALYKAEFGELPQD
ncbi:MAG: Clp protease ClpP [Bacteroidales bacterium]|jgi:ATP-dependent Clp endopeptidase proteolytic subunit ClpP|nr:Clp protease ClpP [Bacteroidales bacterium]